MNNSNGAALIARIRAGSMVTIRLESGAMLTRKVSLTHTGRWFMRDSHGCEHEPTASNVTRVQP